MGDKYTTKLSSDGTVPPDVPPEPLLMVEVDATLTTAHPSINTRQKATHQAGFTRRRTKLKGSLNAIRERLKIEVVVQYTMVGSLSP